MTSAIVMHATGGPDVLQWEPVEVAGMQAHEVLLRHTAVGVNYHDAYVRSGLYKTLALPGIPGIEAAGVVESGRARMCKISRRAIAWRTSRASTGLCGTAGHRRGPARAAAGCRYRHRGPPRRY